MNELAIPLVFIIGYAAIALEHPLKVNKAASALVTGMLCWTIFMWGETDKEGVLQQIETHMGDISSILFFLMGAMVVVELIDAHNGFEIITSHIRTTDKRKLLWITGLITFLLSSVLDNLTTTIVMVSLLRKLIGDREDRMFFTGIIVVAANAGGAWSPIGDVTTTMLWIGGQISALNIMKMLFIPSIVCLLVPLLAISLKMRGKVETPHKDLEAQSTSSPLESNIIFFMGMGVLLFVPVFKTFAHLPPFMGMLLGLGIMWIVTEMIHSEKDEAEKGLLSVNHALRKIDTPSILFFLGILLAISALQSNGLLDAVSTWLDQTIGNQTIIVLATGFLSAIVDNVPLIAACQGMYSLEQYPMDHFIWEFLAYCTGTGGSILIIGSAAGVAAMGMEKIDFIWYFKRVSLLAMLGYLAGAAAYVVQFTLLH